MDNWLQINCPFCRVPFQIKEAYAHLRGRCPSCGFRIEPIKPKPYEERKNTSTSDEPMGLVPIDEEWPEPARLVGHDDRLSYGVATGTIAARESWEEAPKPPPIGFADEPGKPQAAAPQAPTQPKKPIVAQPVDDPPAPPKKPAPIPTASFAPPNQRPKPSPAPEVDILGEPIVKPGKPPAAPPEPMGRTMEIPNLKPVLPPPLDPLPAEPAPPVPKTVREDVYNFSDKDLPGPTTAKGEPTPYRRTDIDFEVPPTPPVPPPEPPPLESHSPYKLSDAELEPERPPPVPLNLFWTGVWNFAFRVRNLWPLFWLTLGFAIMGIQIEMILALNAMELQLASVAAFFVGLGVFFVLIITGSYASTCFLAILQDTANAADQIEYPEHDWRMGTFSLLRLGWLTALGLGLPALLFSMLGCLGYGLFILLTPALFSFCLLSALARDSWIMIFDPQVMAGLKRRPDVIPIVYVYSLALLLVCVLFAVLAFTLSWIFVPIMAFVFAVSWLTFARILGRVGYAISEDPKKKRKKKKKKKRKAKVETDKDDDDDGEEATLEDDPGEPPP